MYVTLTPNVREAMAADPVMAFAIEYLRRDARRGFLHLSRSRRDGPFCAEFYAPGGNTKRQAESPVLADAILRAVEP